MARKAKRLRENGKDSFSVCVLERGLEIRPGQYPSTFASGVRAMQDNTRFGSVGRRTSLFDFQSTPT
jgi:cholesterol oxidase